MIGIIGGTGLYELEGFVEEQSLNIETPYGPHSGSISIGTLKPSPLEGEGDFALAKSGEGALGQKLIFLPRHNKQHDLLPSEINYRANIWALKKLGAKAVISVSSVGSLSESIQPGDFVIPDQYFDWTRGKRESSFFGDGLLAHVSMAEPSCDILARGVQEIAETQNRVLHRPATCVTVEGPRYSTKVESEYFRALGGHIIGMTAAPEVFLAREAQLCHITLAAVTDYDCWKLKPSEHVSALQVTEQAQSNLKHAIELLQVFLKDMPDLSSCSCRKALEGAIITPDSQILDSQRVLLELLRK
ncbi:MAG: MTAP family purine nucleoside phosphorylase [Deltaproteobacteria bacterium]|nr:MTAP family purine nucleoside phosphorylase [Deltaproteobacteria bacterium]